MSEPLLERSRRLAEMRPPARMPRASAGAGRLEGLEQVADLVAERLRLAFGAARISDSAARGGSAAHRVAEAAVSADPRALRRVLSEEGLDADAAQVDFLAASRDLLEPAAERLGALWAEDGLSFAAVNIAVNRLSAAARSLAERAERSTPERNDRRRILLATAPGESHDLGLILIASACRLDGWDVALRLGARPDDLAGLARAEAFDLIGVSVASDASARGVRDLIASLRAASRGARPKDVGVVVGGGAVRARAGLGAELGADAAASTIDGAAAQLNELLDVMRAVR